MRNKLLTLAIIAATVACDKEDLDETPTFNVSTIVEYNPNASSISGKSTTSELTIENHSFAEIEVVTTPQGDNVTVFKGKLVEETTAEYPNIIGSVAYQLIDFEDTTQNPDLIGATINYADGTKIVVDPTSSFELN